MKKKAVFCVNDGKVYPSITAAAKSWRISKSYISKQLSGAIKKTAGCLVFVAVDGTESDAELQELQRRVISEQLGIFLII